jgi:hypothetical protein
MRSNFSPPIFLTFDTFRYVKWYAAQVILKIDPREIGSAFHRAGAEISEKGNFWMETN